jgi:drug/metabolite transporter (DMT)-like permease
MDPSASPARSHPIFRHALAAHRRMSELDANVRALLWSAVSGLLFVTLNSIMRELSTLIGGFETQFLRYFMGLMVLVPLMLKAGIRSYWPKNVAGQFTRGAVHTAGLLVWFVALPNISLAETTAISFTTPLFIMFGAALVLKEPMRWHRWVGSALGFAGVLIVVAPNLHGQAGWYGLVMLASSPIYAVSYLLTKALTRYERVEVIVAWQAITVATLSLPLALWHWQAPTAGQWAACVLCGMLGTTGHYCLTRSYAAAHISATQSVKFLDLVWATLIGWLAFGDHARESTFIGGVVICASTLWIARREARGAR